SKICSQRRTEYERQSLRRNRCGRDRTAGRNFSKVLLGLSAAPPPAEAQDPSRYPGSPRRRHHAARAAQGTWDLLLEPKRKNAAPEETPSVNSTRDSYKASGSGARRRLRRQRLRIQFDLFRSG